VASKPFTFPRIDYRSNYMSGEVFPMDELNKDLAALGDIKGEIDKSADQLLIGDEGNAGTVYVTINPNTTNFTDKMVTLENSQGVAAPVTLSPLQRTDHVKSFGWTRGADNGFYEAKATIGVEDIKSGRTKANVNFNNSVNEIKDIILDSTDEGVTKLKNNWKAIVKDFVSDSYNSMSDILDANAVKATYTDYVNGTATERSVYSEYNTAVTAIYPLTFNTGADFNFKNVPGFAFVESKVSRVFDYVGTTIANAVKINAQDVVFESVSFDIDIDAEEVISGVNFKVQMDTTFTLPKILVFDTDKFYSADGSKDYSLSSITFDIVSGAIAGIGSVTSSSETVSYKKGEFKHYVETEIYYVSKADNTKYNSYDEWAAAGKPDATEYAVQVVKQYNSETAVIDGIGIMTKDGSDYVIKLSVTEDLNPEAKKVVENLNKQITASTASLNDKLTQLNSVANNLNILLDDVRNINNKVNTAVDDVKDRVLSYIELVNDKMVGYINQFYKAMQPVCFVEATDGLHQISQSYVNASWLKSSNLQLYPTTWNAELLAPAYKKFVAVTKAYKDDVNDAAEVTAVNANNDLLQVFDGAGKNYVNINGLNKGYIYEITYMAVDFRGYIAARKYYVRVQ